MAELARLRAIVRDTDPDRVVGGGFPLLEPLRSLQGGRLSRGAVVAIEGEAGRTSLAMAMLAGVSATGGWCGVVGMPAFGCLAAQQMGVRLETLALVPRPGVEWAQVVGILIAGLDAILVDPATPVSGGLARRLAAMARQHRCTLLTLGPVWEGADVRLLVRSQDWLGLGQQRGRLRSRRLTVAASHRPLRELALWLPFEDGSVRAVDGDVERVRPSDVVVAGSPAVASVQIA